jgi:hypothetical protein
VTIPEVGDVELPRSSALIVTGPVDGAARGLKIGWPKGSGGVVLRQNGVEDPYTGYLQGGEVTPTIPISGGLAQSPQQAFVDYIPVGYTHILPKGLDQDRPGHRRAAHRCIHRFCRGRKRLCPQIAQLAHVGDLRIWIVAWAWLCLCPGRVRPA